jgi:hypothetical protein
VAFTDPPYTLQGGVINHPARVFRRALAGVLQEGVNSLNGFGDLAVTATGTGLQTAIARGGCYIKGDDGTDQGLYHGYNDATVNITLDAADGTNPRIDLIVARVKDTEYGISGDVVVVEKVTGTPAASPVEPTLPPTALKLASILVTNGLVTLTAGNITDKRYSARFARNYVKAYRSTQLAIPDSTATNVRFNSETEDNWNMHVSGTNDYRFTVPVAGVWQFEGVVQFANSPTGDRRLDVMLNGVIVARIVVPAASNVSNPGIPFFIAVRANATDYFSVQAWQNSNGSLDVNAGEAATWAAAWQVSD